jgi:hypothetical protein
MMPHEDYLVELEMFVMDMRRAKDRWRRDAQRDT